jgi:hypothetical protein
MSSWKAWKTKAATWLKRALIILVVTIAVLVGLFIIYKIFVGVVKESYRKKIANYEAELSVPPIAQGYGQASFGLPPYAQPPPYGYSLPQKPNVTF